MRIAYLNGEIIPESELSLSFTDTGFVLGAAVAEQLRTFGGKIFRLDDHLVRLRSSLNVLGLDRQVNLSQLRDAMLQVAEHNYKLVRAGSDLGVSVVVTPGPYPSYSGATDGPTVAVHTYELPFRLWAHKYRVGQSLRTVSIRQVPSNCWPRHLKCRSRMHYYLADREAQQAEPGSRALLLDQDGLVTEASTANVIIYRKDSGLAYPPLDRVLRGISLKVVLELAESLSIPARQVELTVDHLHQADEILLTSTPNCILPVTRFNGQPVGTGEPGPIFKQLIKAWSTLVGVDIVGQAQQFV